MPKLKSSHMDCLPFVEKLHSSKLLYIIGIDNKCNVDDLEAYM